MNEKDIINFRNSLASLSLDDLKKEKMNLDNAISKMVLDNDLIIKASILNELINSRKDK